MSEEQVIAVPLFDYPEDIDRIKAALWKKGLDVNAFQAAWLWNKYSQSLGARWLNLENYDADEIVTALSDFMERVDVLST